MTVIGTVVALDVGGTAMKGAVVDRAATVRYTESRPTGAERGPDAVVAAIGEFAADLAARAGETGEPEAAGVVVPGLIDECRGVAVFAANLGWRDVPLRSALAARLDRPTALGHDVRAAALAETRLGAARGSRDFLFLALGTGIAGGIVLSGRPYAGAGVMGGEIGHVPVRPDGEPCRCGQRGCLEVYASAAGIRRRFCDASGEPVDGTRAVLDRAAAGDPVAGRVWTEAVDALAAALATYVLTLDPELIVVGGGLAAAGDRLFEPVRAGLAARLAFRSAPPVVPTELGEQAGCLGAAVLAWQLVGTELGS